MRFVASSGYFYTAVGIGIVGCVRGSGGGTSSCGGIRGGGGRRSGGRAYVQNVVADGTRREGVLKEGALSQHIRRSRRSARVEAMASPTDGSS